MAVTPVNPGSIIRDVLFFFKDFLSGAIPDPITNRPANQSFIMTSYPTRAVTYPLITIKDTNQFVANRLGFQSEATQNYIDTEIRMWGRNVKERDETADKIFNQLKNNQIGAGSTSQSFDLHDFKLLNSVNIDTPDGAKTKVQTYRFLYVAT